MLKLSTWEEAVSSRFRQLVAYYSWPLAMSASVLQVDLGLDLTLLEQQGSLSEPLPVDNGRKQLYETNGEDQSAIE